MDEQRLQAYYQLIESLLSCPSGEEPEILAANTELLDADFVQVVAAVAEDFAQQGDENTANWLRNLAAYLTPKTPAITEEDIDVYLPLILEVLRTTAECNGDPQVIYPLLAANTDKLNPIFAELLRRWATNTLAEAEPDTTTSIAAVIVELSNLIQQFPLGSKANNIEIAITGYEIALTVLTRTAFPVDWASTQNNLAIAYRNRILGDKAQNIEQAIASFTAALEVYTCTAFPQQWASTQNNLGNAYKNRILGDKAQNIELAIASFTAALEVRTRTAFPQQWASTQNNLGNAYWDRILGDKAQNIEQAIASFTAALEVYTRTAFPQQWAMTQNNLGNAYTERILGDKAENTEQAIASFTAALEVYTRTAFPQDWAMTQNNLATAYWDRILGDKAQNIEQAIASYSAALEVYTHTAFPQQWATAQNNLGNAYAERILGDKAQNIELAIASYSAALEVRTRTAFPQDWAMTQNNLGNAYWDRILGDKAQNIEQAIASYSTALEVLTRTAFPQDWATTQNNLATAYSERILGDKAENIEKAIASYSAALEVRTRTAFPQNHAETLLNLGRLYQEEKEFDLAYNTFAQAIETVESLRGEIKSGEEAKRKQAEEWNQLYRRMVEVCLALGKDTEAIEYIERSKTRNLVELLTKAASITPENVPSVNSSIRFAEIQNLLENETAIIQWYIFADCFRAFIITRDNQPIIWKSEEKDLDKLVDWIKNYLFLYWTDKRKWHFQLNAQLTQLTQILHLNQIVSLVPPHCQKLILIPHRYLHLLPLHAIPLSANNSAQPEYLFDKFPRGVSYAPSCQLLQFTQRRAKNLDNSQLNQLSHLFAIQNPTNDLIFTDIEVETIATGFQPQQILKHHQATKTALATQPVNQNLNNSQWLHFSCHGYFNFDSPLKSGLQLADAVVSKTSANSNSSRYLRVDEETELDLDKCLTLEDIFQIKLNNCRLVCLSACETGLIDSTNNSDEYIGLASGFINAGAANIISSLWAVSDFHTALLMIKFYENLPKYQYNMPLALNHTQQWLRQATQTQIIDWLHNLNNMQLKQKQLIIKVLETQYKPEQQPFRKPEFWAAFCAISPVYS